jgi:RNA polymerase sigma-70 factor (ECF subfamily)
VANDTISAINSTSTNGELQVARCLDERSASCWSKIVTIFQRTIASTVIKRCRGSNWDSSRIEDLIQDVYVRLCCDDFRILRESRGTSPASIFSLVQAVTVTTILDSAAKSIAVKRGGDIRIQSIDSSLQVGSFIDPNHRLMIDKVDLCLRTMGSQPQNVRDRRIFWLYHRQGFSAKDIASLPGIGLSVKGVESAIHRLGQEVRRYISGEDSSQKGVGA